MSEKIVYEIVYPQNKMTYEIIKNWFQMGCKCFVPSTMAGRLITRGRSNKYCEKVFYGGLKKEFEGELLSVRLTTTEGDMLVAARNVDTLDKYILLFKTDEGNIGTDFDMLVEKMMLTGGVVAHKCSSDDDFWQNAENLEYYHAKGKSIANIKIKPSPIFPSEEIVDVEYNPGHNHRPLGMWFGSCYQMWFGRDYFQYISKETLQMFSDCSENIMLGNDVIRITLYDDLWAYDEPDNRRRQSAFRTQVGVDIVAHMLGNSATPDPGVEVLTGVFSNGGVRLIKHYYSSAGTIVPKSSAAKMVIAEFSEHGEILHQEEHNLYPKLF